MSVAWKCRASVLLDTIEVALRELLSCDCNFSGSASEANGLPTDIGRDRGGGSENKTILGDENIETTQSKPNEEGIFLT